MIKTPSSICESSVEVFQDVKVPTFLTYAPSGRFFLRLVIPGPNFRGDLGVTIIGCKGELPVFRMCPSRDKAESR